MGDSYNDALMKQIDQWTQDILNDDAKLSAWKAYNHRIPSKKDAALDELFGVSK